MSFHPVIMTPENVTIDLHAWYKHHAEAEEQALRVFSAYVLSGAYRHQCGDRLVIVNINDNDSAMQQVVAEFDPSARRWYDPW